MSQPRYKSEVVDFEDLAERLEELERLGYTCDWDLLERQEFGPLKAWVFATLDDGAPAAEWGDGAATAETE